MRVSLLPTILAIVTLGGSVAHASLIGDSVTVQLNAPAVGFSSSQTVTVGAGEEGNFVGSQFFDFGANSFSVRSTVTATTFAGGNGTISYALSDLDLGAPIIGVDVKSPFTGVTTAFTADSVTLSFPDQAVPAATYLSATFQTATVSAVPEPASLALLGAGLFGAGLTRRRKHA